MSTRNILFICIVAFAGLLAWQGQIQNRAAAAPAISGSAHVAPGLIQRIDRIESVLVPPIGAILPYYGDPADLPPGWQLCDGSSLDDAADSSLRSRLGGDDAHVPDLRGTALAGVGPTTGVDAPGAESETELGQMFRHKHHHDMKHTHAVPPHRHDVNIDAETGNAVRHSETAVIRTPGGQNPGVSDRNMPRTAGTLAGEGNYGGIRVDRGMFVMGTRFGNMHVTHAHHRHPVNVRGRTQPSARFDTEGSSRENTGEAEGLPHMATYFIIRVR